MEGTIHTVAADIERDGGRALAIQLDVCDEAAIAQAIDRTAREFRGLDIAGVIVVPAEAGTQAGFPPTRE